MVMSPGAFCASAGPGSLRGAAGTESETESGPGGGAERGSGSHTAGSPCPVTPPDGWVDARRQVSWLAVPASRPPSRGNVPSGAWPEATAYSCGHSRGLAGHRRRTAFPCPLRGDRHGDCSRPRPPGCQRTPCAGPPSIGSAGKALREARGRVARNPFIFLKIRLTSQNIFNYFNMINPFSRVKSGSSDAVRFWERGCPRGLPERRGPGKRDPERPGPSACARPFRP